MAVYFFDTSALVKRYVSETGSDAVTAIVEAPETIVVIADLTRAEITSAISRRKRTGHLSADDYEALKVVIARHLATEYLLVPIDTERINAACGLIEQHGLRAYDAIQLAAALTVRAISHHTARRLRSSMPTICCSMPPVLKGRLSSIPRHRDVRLN